MLVTNSTPEMEYHISTPELSKPCELEDIRLQETPLGPALLLVPSLELTPCRFNGLRMGTGLRVDEVLRMVDCTMIVHLWQILNVNVGSPHVTHDGRTRSDEALNDW